MTRISDSRRNIKSSDAAAADNCREFDESETWANASEEADRELLEGAESCLKETGEAV